MEKNKIIGFFVSYQSLIAGFTVYEKEKVEKQGKLFEDYVWHNLDSLDKKLGNIAFSDFGFDLELILFEFYINPLEYEKNYHKNEIGNYNKNEKSVGIPVFVTDELFFNRKEYERKQFLNEIISKKLLLLKEVIKKKKLDTDIDKLIITVLNKLK